MHDTAKEYGKSFFKVYVNSKENQTIVDVGSFDVNGALRDYTPNGSNYIGLDFVVGKSVDIVLEDAYHFPLPDNYADFIVTSSCFEHSQFFWQTFIESLRVLKPNGVMYVSAPSNGVYHRYPTDNWRFYPDSAKALSAYANSQGYNTIVLESFIGQEGPAAFRDFVGVFLKDKQFVEHYPNRIYNSVSKNLEPNNIWSYGSDNIINYQDWMAREDSFSLIKKQLEVLSENGNIQDIKTIWSKVLNELAASSLYLASQNGHFDTVKFFLEQNINVDIKASNGLTPLFGAIKNKHYKVSELLLEHKADPDTSITNGLTPVFLSSMVQDVYMTALLVKYGVKTNVKFNGVSLIENAELVKNQDILKLLQDGLPNFCYAISEKHEAEFSGNVIVEEVY